MGFIDALFGFDIFADADIHGATQDIVQNVAQNVMQDAQHAALDTVQNILQEITAPQHQPNSQAVESFITEHMPSFSPSAQVGDLIHVARKPRLRQAEFWYRVGSTRHETVINFIKARREAQRAYLLQKREEAMKIVTNWDSLIAQNESDFENAISQFE